MQYSRIGIHKLLLYKDTKCHVGHAAVSKWHRSNESKKEGKYTRYIVFSHKQQNKEHLVAKNIYQKHARVWPGTKCLSRTWPSCCCHCCCCRCHNRACRRPYLYAQTNNIHRSKQKLLKHFKLIVLSIQCVSLGLPQFPYKS